MSKVNTSFFLPFVLLVTACSTGKSDTTQTSSFQDLVVTEWPKFEPTIKSIKTKTIIRYNYEPKFNLIQNIEIENYDHYGNTIRYDGVDVSSEELDTIVGLDFSTYLNGEDRSYLMNNDDTILTVVWIDKYRVHFHKQLDNIFFIDEFDSIGNKTGSLVSYPEDEIFCVTRYIPISYNGEGLFGKALVLQDCYSNEEYLSWGFDVSHPDFALLPEIHADDSVSVIHDYSYSYY